jgi:hypothetical protein
MLLFLYGPKIWETRSKRIRLSLVCSTINRRGHGPHVNRTLWWRIPGGGQPEGDITLHAINKCGNYWQNSCPDVGDASVTPFRTRKKKIFDNKAVQRIFVRISNQNQFCIENPGHQELRIPFGLWMVRFARFSMKRPKWNWIWHKNRTPRPALVCCPCL